MFPLWASTTDLQIARPFRRHPESIQAQTQCFVPDHQMPLEHILGQRLSTILMSMTVVRDHRHRPHAIEQIVHQDLFRNGLNRRPYGIEADQVKGISNLHTVFDVIQISQPAIKAIAGVNIEVAQHGVGQWIRTLQQHVGVGGDQSSDFRQISKLQEARFLVKYSIHIVFHNGS